MSVAPATLAPISALAATSFSSTAEALDGVLTLAQNMLGMGSVFVTEADREAGHLTVVATREGAEGLGIPLGLTVPFEHTV